MSTAGGRTPSRIRNLVSACRYDWEHNRLCKYDQSAGVVMPEVKSERQVYADRTALLQKAGVAPKLTQQTVQVSTVLGLVASGLGLALVPSANVRYYAADVVYRKLRGVPPEVSIGIALAHRPDSTNPAVAHFIASAAVAVSKKSAARG